jgi:hypothetical protein
MMPLMNVASIERSRSATQPPDAPPETGQGPVLLGAVIAVVSFRSTVRGLPKDHAVAALTRLRHAHQRPGQHTTLADVTIRPVVPGMPVLIAETAATVARTRQRDLRLVRCHQEIPAACLTWSDVNGKGLRPLENGHSRMVSQLSVSHARGC